MSARESSWCASQRLKHTKALAWGGALLALMVGYATDAGATCGDVTLSPPTGTVLQPADLGVLYSAAFHASGGTAYEWSASSIPSGLTIATGDSVANAPVDGLSGVPAAPGTYTFTVGVADWPNYAPADGGAPASPCSPVTNTYTLTVSGGTDAGNNCSIRGVACGGGGEKACCAELMCGLAGTCCAAPGGTCRDDSDCCAPADGGSFCAAGTCEVCASTGETCTAASCCPGLECSTTCCVPAAGACSHDSDCCGELECLGGTCSAAPRDAGAAPDGGRGFDGGSLDAGAGCGTDGGCTDDDGGCVVAGDECSASSTCCVYDAGYYCISGTCQTCVNAGDACPGGGCCAGLSCDPGSITCCAPPGGTCTQDTDCCDGVRCVDNVCNDVAACGAAGDSCGATAPCCRGMTCGPGATCVEEPTDASVCSSEGDPCKTTLDCCTSSDGGATLTCIGGACSQCDQGNACCTPRGQACAAGSDCCANDECIHGVCSTPRSSGCASSGAVLSTLLIGLVLAVLARRRSSSNPRAGARP